MAAFVSSRWLLPEGLVVESIWLDTGSIVLSHGYATIEDRLVWSVVEGALPSLLARLSRVPE